MLQGALLCLALNIYHEARGEPQEGQVAVAMVTMNRAEWKTHNICDVVYEKNQFSWTLKADRAPREQAAWLKAQKIASKICRQKHKDKTLGATHFHTTSARPYWRHNLKRTTKIGRHIFYAKR